MAFPTIFGTLVAGNQPASLFDTMFSIVAGMGAVECTATGTNTILLTPVANMPTVSAYAALNAFAFVAAGNNTGATTINVSGVGALPLLKAGGAAMIGGEVLTNQVCIAVTDGLGSAWLISPSAISTSTPKYPPTTHGTGYTQVAADLQTTMVASSGGVVAWTAMSGATAGNGAVQYISVDVAGTVMTLTRAGTDTFASGGSTALTTLTLTSGDRGYLISNGASPSIWRWWGARHSDTGQQAITAGGALTLPHGLGVQPSVVQLWLHCTSADGGYANGDEINMSGADVNDSATSGHGAANVPDATNLNIRFGSAATTFSTINKGSGATANLTNANWRAIWRAWVYN